MAGLVKVARDGGVVRVSLNRPESRNALSGELLEELRLALDGLSKDPSVRVLVLAGEGKDFCAGADLNEMKRLGAASKDENRADAARLAGTFSALAAFPRAVVGCVQGNVFGGGVGLVAACDIAVVADDARFAFSEVRLGIIPAVISPYVVRRLGAGMAKRLFLTGERFDGAEAVRIGLAARSAPAAGLDAAVDSVVQLILRGSPDAQRRIKLLVDAVAVHDPEEARAVTPGLIADARASEEGQEGLKRVPGEAEAPVGAGAPRDGGCLVKKVLVANRGEIACRVLAALRERQMAVGCRLRAMPMPGSAATCAPPTNAVRDRSRAGQSSPTSGRRAGSWTRRCPSGAEAVHPGYGFLAENAALARGRRRCRTRVPRAAPRDHRSSGRQATGPHDGPESGERARRAGVGG